MNRSPILSVVGASTFITALALAARGDDLDVLIVGDTADVSAILSVADSPNPAPHVFCVDHLPEAEDYLSRYGLVIVADRDCSVLADHRLLVIRGCYLAFRRALSLNLDSCDGIVLFEEEGRALGARDVSDVFEIPIVGFVTVNTEGARTVDAGTFALREDNRTILEARTALSRLGILTAVES